MKKKMKAIIAVFVCWIMVFNLSVLTTYAADSSTSDWVWFVYDTLDDSAYDNEPLTDYENYSNAYDVNTYPDDRSGSSYAYNYSVGFRRCYISNGNCVRINYKFYSNSPMVCFFTNYATYDEEVFAYAYPDDYSQCHMMIFFISLKEISYDYIYYNSDGSSGKDVFSVYNARKYTFNDETVYLYARDPFSCTDIISKGNEVFTACGIYSEDMNVFTSLESAYDYLKNGTIDEDSIISGPDKPATPKSDTTIGLSSFTCGNLITSGFEGKYGIVCNYAMAAQSFNPPASNPTLPRSLKVKFDITWTVDYVRYSSANATRPIETITTTYYTTSWGPPIVDSAGNQIKFGCVDSIKNSYSDSWDAALLSYFLEDACDNTSAVGVFKTIGSTVITTLSTVYGQPAGGAVCNGILDLMCDSLKQSDYYGIGNLTCYIKATPYDSATNSYGQYEACSLNAMTGVATTTSFGPTEVNNESYSYDSDPAESDYTKTDDTTYSIDGLGNIVISGGGGSSSSASNVTNVSFPDSITLKFGNALQVAGVSSGSSDDDTPDITIEDDDYTDTELRGDLSDGFGLLDDASTDQGKDGFLYSVLSLYDDFDPDIRKMLMFGTSSIVAIAIIQKIIRR